MADNVDDETPIPDPAAVVPAVKPEDPPAGDPVVAKPVTPAEFDVAKLVLPEGAAFSSADVQGIADDAKTLGLSQEQAQKYVDRRVAMVKANNDRFLSELTGDPEIGGAKLAATTEAARRGRDFLLPRGTPTEQADADFVIGYIEQMGVGNHPAFVRMFRRAGIARTEDRPGPTGTPAAPEGERKRTADLLYEPT